MAMRSVWVLEEGPKMHILADMLGSIQTAPVLPFWSIDSSGWMTRASRLVMRWTCSILVCLT